MNVSRSFREVATCPTGVLATILPLLAALLSIGCQLTVSVVGYGSGSVSIRDIGQSCAVRQGTPCIKEGPAWLRTANRDVDADSNFLGWQGCFMVAGTECRVFIAAEQTQVTPLFAL